MSDLMNAREVKKVIEASIFNPTMRKDAKDFVDAQETRIEELETALKVTYIAMQKVRDDIPGMAYAAIITIVSEWVDAWDLVQKAVEENAGTS